MRKPSEIISKFPEEMIRFYHAMLKNPQFYEEVYLKVSYSLLNIPSDSFQKIPSRAEKKHFLDYKYFFTFFELASAKYENGDYAKHLESLRELMQLASRTIEATIHKYEDKYQPKGLRELSKHSGNVARKKEEMQEEVVDLEGTVMLIAPKPGGIEPGFVAMHLIDLISLLRERYPDEQAFFAFVEQEKGDIEKVQRDNEAFLPEYIYKLDYQTDEKQLPKSVGRTYVYLKEQDVQRTATVRQAQGFGMFTGFAATKFYETVKNGYAFEKNIEAFTESLATDLAKAMLGEENVQNLTLYKSLHNNGALKFMLSIEKAKAAQDFGGSGGKKAVGDEKKVYCYRGKELLLPVEGITSVTDRSVLHLGRYLIPFMYLADNDNIGTRMGNNMVRPLARDMYTGERKKDFFVIDLGHVGKESTHPLQGSILPDTRFEQPMWNAFKNFSSLTDNLLSEKIKGALLVAKFMGRVIDREVILKHGQEFALFYDSVSIAKKDEIFQSYINYCMDCKVNDHENEEEYKLYINAIEKMKMNLEKGALILKVFEGYLLHEPMAIDLADNLNKFCAIFYNKVSLLAINKKHGLQHLAIHASYKKTWTISLKEDMYIFACPFQDNLRKFQSEIKKIFDSKGVSSYVSIVPRSGLLSLQFDKRYLSKVMECFCEDALKEKFFPKEVKALRQANAEIALRNYVKAPWFLQKGLCMEMQLHPSCSNTYRITLQWTKEHLGLKKWLVEKWGDTSQIDFQPADLEAMLESFVLFQSMPVEETILKESSAGFFKAPSLHSSTDLSSSFSFRDVSEGLGSLLGRAGKLLQNEESKALTESIITRVTSEEIIGDKELFLNTMVELQSSIREDILQPIENQEMQKEMDFWLDTLIASYLHAESEPTSTTSCLEQKY